MSDGRAPHELHIPVEPPQQTNRASEAQFSKPEEAQAVILAVTAYDQSVATFMRHCEKQRQRATNFVAQIEAGIHIPIDQTREMSENAIMILRAAGNAAAAAMTITNLLNIAQKESN